MKIAIFIGVLIGAMAFPVQLTEQHRVDDSTHGLLARSNDYKPCMLVNVQATPIGGGRSINCNKRKCEAAGGRCNDDTEDTAKCKSFGLIHVDCTGCLCQKRTHPGG